MLEERQTDTETCIQTDTLIAYLTPLARTTCRQLLSTFEVSLIAKFGSKKSDSLTPLIGIYTDTCDTSAHRGKWGQLTPPPGKMDEKLKRS